MSGASLHEIYARLEDRFRGSRVDVLGRLRVYQPLLDLLSGPDHSRIAIDYGCGRGEWLQLLRDGGWQARGVDLNAGMLAEAAAHDLVVERADALAHLSGLPDASVGLISAFHLAEHLPTETLLTFVAEAMRALTPNGVLILETPNPESLLVSTSNFYLDPTHERPIPPLLLQFFVEDAGATVAEVVRLNGEPDGGMAPGPFEATLRPMFTKSLDYAVVGTPSTDPTLQEAVRSFARAASQQPPVDLSKLAAVDTESAERHAAVVEKLGTQDARASAAEAAMRALHEALLERFDAMRATVEAGHDRTDVAAAALARDVGTLTAQVAEVVALNTVRDDLEDANLRLSKLAQETAAREGQLEAQLVALRRNLEQTSQALAEKLVRESQLTRQIADLYASNSWRITRPVRAVSELAQRLRGRRPAGAAAVAAAAAPGRSVRSRERFLMIDPDPASVAAWEALYLGSAHERKS